MARDHARVNVTIWGDPSFRKLPPPAQHLYLALWTSPDLTYCGVHDWRPARLTGLAAGWTKEAIQAAADCLVARHFLVIDAETEEVLIRSWIRWDGLMKQPRMAISAVTAYASVASSTLREVVVHQFKREQSEHPDLACWDDKRVQEVLTHPSVSAKELPTPEDPFGHGFAHGFGVGLAQTHGKVSGSVSVPPTPAPAPAPYLHGLPADEPDDDDAAKASRRRPERPLPASWVPTAKHHEFANQHGIDIDAQAIRFRNHADTHDRRARNWDAAFRTWLSKAAEGAPQQRGTNSWLDNA
ncbi:hypothetical protein [Pseudactinotalea sp. Z1748]|uniref:hypothetical protein n=1 Tax=Pseudactinotalea sp. Z1748 TaxID=3413027 RepID=UPI003C7DA2D7